MKKASIKKAGIKSASYPKTSVSEIEAITAFDFFVDPKYIKTDIKKLDKFPNIDGYIELTDGENNTTGKKLEVQIKALNIKDLKKPKHQAKGKLLKYCTISPLPLLLILFSKQAKEGYWIHLSRDLSLGLLKKIKKNSIVVHIPKENIISEKNTDYIEKWNKIAGLYQSKIFNYDKVKLENEKLKKTQEEIHSSFSKEPIDPLICTEVHKFLDKLNNYLDNEFSIVKKIFYPNVWKIGLAFSEYTDNRVSYFLFTINETENTSQIKKIKDPRKFRSKGETIGYYGYNHTNIIRSNPEKPIQNLLRADIENILKNRLILVSNAFLAQEFLSEFVGKYYLFLGLEQRAIYSIEELENGFYRFLPLWLDEYFKNQEIEDDIEIDLDSIYISADEMQAYSTLVDQSFPSPKRKYFINNAFYPVSYFEAFIQQLKDLNITKVVNPYQPKKKLLKKEYFVWEAYGSESLRKNLEILYQNFPQTYNQMVESHFPHWKDKLKLFDNYDKLIIVLDDSPMGEQPYTNFYYLQKIDGFRETSIQIVAKNTYNDLHPQNMLGRITIEDSDYILIRWNATPYNFENLPMQSLLFRVLMEKFSKILPK